MTPFPSYRSASFRLIALFTVIVAGVCAIALLVQFATTRAAIEAQHRAILTADMDGFSTLYEQRRIVSLRQSIELRSLSDGGDMVLFLQDRNGVKLAGTLPDWPSDIAPVGTNFEPDQVQEYAAADGGLFSVVATTLPGGFDLLVGRNRDHVNWVLRKHQMQIWGLAGAIVVASLIAGWFFVNNFLWRINRINRLAETVAQGDITARLPKSGAQDEFAVMDQHINEMLDRLNALHHAILRVSDAIAHELRTPLNRIHQKIEDLPTGLAQKAEILQEINRTVRVFDSLLDISLTEAQKGQASGMKPVDLSLLVAEICDLYEPLSEDKNLTYVSDVTPDLQVVGNQSLLAQLLSNLLDNAIKFTRAGDTIETRLRLSQNRVILTVRDTGPGMPKDIGASAFEKFVRSERDRATEGHGLGLALVHAIATRHGAKLTLPETKNGFAIEVSWDRFDPDKPRKS